MLVTRIHKAKEQADYVLVITHGGYERCPYPSPRMIRTYRAFIDAGADAVVNHHQHCVSGFELYSGKPVFYGLGNFLFPAFGEENRSWHEGMMVELVFGRDIPVSFNLIPFVQCLNVTSVKLMDADSISCFNEMIDNLNKVISDPEALEDQYDAFMDRHSDTYGKIFRPTGKVAKWLTSLGVVRPFLSSWKRLALEDYVGCESHREALLRYLEKGD